MSAFFLKICASRAFALYHKKNTMIYSAFVKSARKASAEGASEKKNLTEWPRWLNHILKHGAIQMNGRIFARKKKRTQVKICALCVENSASKTHSFQNGAFLRGRVRLNAQNALWIEHCLLNQNPFMLKDDTCIIFFTIRIMSRSAKKNEAQIWN